jgi:chaperonin GroES
MKKENIRPLRDNVFVKLLKKDTRTKSGIVLPETASEDKPQEGKIIAIGDSKEIKVKNGQTVIFAKYSGTEIKLNNEDYLLIKNEDLLAIVK